MNKHDEPRGFLNRWSARKQAVEQQQEVETTSPPITDAPFRQEPPAVPEEEVPPVPTAARTDSSATASDTGDKAHSDQTTRPLLGDADMPPIETLTASSDISGFFSKGVSAALRKAALRHVFRQSSYNVRDGLNDYDGDFTSYEPLGDTITSDMKFHAIRKEKARLEAENEARNRARLEAERVEQEEEARLEAEKDTLEEEARLEAERDAQEEEARLEAEEEALEDEDRTVVEEENPEVEDRLDAESEVLEDAFLAKAAQTADAESGIEGPAERSGTVAPIPQRDVDEGLPMDAAARSSISPEKQKNE